MSFQGEVIDMTTLLPPNQTGKSTHREETPSKEARVERSEDKQEHKYKCMGLREAHNRHRPSFLKNYMVNAVQKTSRELDKKGKLIHASNVSIPKNRRDAMRSAYVDFWCLYELEEMAALRAKTCH